MKHRLFRLFSLLTVLALLTGACGANDAATEEQEPLRIAWTLYSGWYPLVIAEQQGIFEKHNVQVELILLETYKDTAPQLASGMVDGAAIVLGDALLEDVGNSSTVVLITDNSFGADQMIASPEVMESQDLKGKRIGISGGTFGELLAREMLKKYGLTFNDVSLVETPPEAVAEAIPGSIDVGHTFEPFASQARAKGNGVLFTSAEAPGIIVDTIAFTDAITAARPDDVRNFIDAWFEAVDYWQKNPEAGAALIAAATGQDVKDVNFEGIKFFDRAANLAAFQPGNDLSSVYFTAQMEMDFLVATNLVTKPLPLDAILDPSFLK